MKTKEELNALKEEVETLKGKLAELSEEELAQVSGGVIRNDLGGRHRDNSPEQTPGQELEQQNRRHESHEEPLVCYHDKRYDLEN